MSRRDFKKALLDLYTYHFNFFVVVTKTYILGRKVDEFIAYLCFYGIILMLLGRQGICISFGTQMWWKSNYSLKIIKHYLLMCTSWKVHGCLSSKGLMQSMPKICMFVCYASIFPYDLLSWMDLIYDYLSLLFIVKGNYIPILSCLLFI